MPVQIDQIESEIEIMPSSDGGGRAGRTSGGAAPASPAVPRVGDGLRRAVARALEEELQEYLRIRG